MNFKYFKNIFLLNFISRDSVLHGDLISINEFDILFLQLKNIFL